MEQHRLWMKRTLELARNGWSLAAPNPMVGCVVVEDGVILAEGWHRGPGTAHAERDALEKLKDRDLSKATLYVNLEPCCHFGRTPPCTDRILESGVGTVVMAVQDPNPLVNGKGTELLRLGGVTVITGVLEEEARQLNDIFFHKFSAKRPFGILKTAMSLDGKIACESGASQWITGPEARAEVHRWRERVTAVLTGIGTVLADDPMLNVRLDRPAHRQPIPIVLDSTGRMPLDSKLMEQTRAGRPLWLAVTEAISDKSAQALEQSGATLITAGAGPRVDMTILFDELYRRDCESVLIEAGSQVNSAALNAGVVDRVLWFIAPMLLGGNNAPGPVASLGIETPAEGLEIHHWSMEPHGKDLLLSGWLKGGV